MHTICRLAALTMIAIPCLGQSPILPGKTPGTPAAIMSTSTSSTVQAVLRAREMVARNPDDVGAYAALGLALCHQGQEASDAKIYIEAEQSINRALQISADNFEAKKAQVCVELGGHEFARAREHAIVLNKRIPDDVSVYGLLVDANSALGNYPEAEDAAQWMLNLRPGNTPAFLHAATLREVFGEQQGALELLKIVLDETSPADVCGRAGLLTQMAHLNLEIGDLVSAQEMGESALSLQPADFRALFVMAQLRLLQGSATEAVQLFRESYKLVPQTETLYSLAEAMEAAGMPAEAGKTFSEFELKAKAQSALPENANRQLVFYYADHVNNPAKALEVAQREVQQRHDVYTLDAYAWALYKNRRFSEAEKQTGIALKVGVREASILYHAGEIELSLGNTVQARQYFSSAAELKSIRSHDAVTALASLRTGPNETK